MTLQPLADLTAAVQRFRTVFEATRSAQEMDAASVAAYNALGAAQVAALIYQAQHAAARTRNDRA